MIAMHPIEQRIEWFEKHEESSRTQDRINGTDCGVVLSQGDPAASGMHWK